jgi:hypothetical protein
MKALPLALLLLLPALAAAQGRGRPPAEDSLQLSSTFSGRDGFDSRSAGFSSAFGLGKAAGYAFSGSAGVEHHRTWTGGRFPGEVYDASFGLRAAGKKWTFGAGARSNSDRPFYSPSETDLNLDASAVLRRRGPHSLMFGLNYSSRRSFLKGVPFPYLSYSYTGERLTVFFPFALAWKIGEASSLRASYFPPKYFSLSVSRKLSHALTLALSGGMQLRQYMLAGRAAKDQSLFLEQTQAGLKASLTPVKGWETSLWTGWGFRGRYYSGEHYDEHRAVVRTGAGPLLSLGLKKIF